MDRIPGPLTDLEKFADWTYEKAEGVMLILDAAPTAAEPLISEGQRGYYNNKVYFMVSGVLKEFAVSSTA